MKHEIYRETLNTGNKSAEIRKWIEDQVVVNPEGRLNEYSKTRREVGAQYTVPDVEPFEFLFRRINQLCTPTDVWINYNPPGARNMPHFHVGGDYAGCWYFQVPDDSGYLMFETGEKFQPLPTELFMWDARRLHWVTTNVGCGPRISIAFTGKRK
jgi:hypothetical protein